MKISLVLKMKIYAQSKYPHFFNGGEFERLAMENGYKAANSGRRAREMCEKGMLERRIGEGGSVEYRWNNNYEEVRPPKIPKRYFNPAEFIGAAERINKIPALEKASIIQNKLF